GRRTRESSPADRRFRSNLPSLVSAGLSHARIARAREEKMFPSPLAAGVREPQGASLQRVDHPVRRLRQQRVLQPRGPHRRGIEAESKRYTLLIDGNDHGTSRTGQGTTLGYLGRAPFPERLEQSEL